MEKAIRRIRMWISCGRETRQASGEKKELEVGGVPTCRGQVGLQFKLGYCALKIQVFHNLGHIKKAQQ